MKLQKALTYLENVTKKSMAVPMRRYAGSTGRTAQGELPSKFLRFLHTGWILAATVSEGRIKRARNMRIEFTTLLRGDVMEQYRHGCSLGDLWAMLEGGRPTPLLLEKFSVGNLG